MNQSFTLQELIQAVADNVRDLVPGETTAGMSDANKFRDDTKGDGRRPRHWQNSEVVFLEPAATEAGRTGAQPFVVTDFIAGEFSLDHNFGGSGVPQGVPYFIIRNHGAGNPYRAYVNAIRRALDNLGAATAVSDSSLTTASGVYTYTVPDALDTVHTVEIHNGTTGPFTLRPDQWNLFPGRQIRIVGNVSVAYPWTLTLHGRSFNSMPLALNDTVVCDLDEVVDRASEALLRSGNKPVEQAKGQAMAGERLRYGRRYALPNETLVIP